ncbi:hypothetical protein ACSBR1_000105 [Camellia fascicularis]
MSVCKDCAYDGLHLISEPQYFLLSLQKVHTLISCPQIRLQEPRLSSQRYYKFSFRGSCGTSGSDSQDTGFDNLELYHMGPSEMTSQTFCWRNNCYDFQRNRPEKGSAQSPWPILGSIGTL